jgi:hypothetical protein
MTEFGIAAAPFTPTIFVGRLSKDQTHFLDGKEDATDMAILAVADYVVAHFTTETGGALAADYSDMVIEVKVTRKPQSAEDEQ